MATTGAQRQAASMARLRARAEIGGKLATMVQGFQETMRAQVAEAGGDPDCASTVSDHVGRVMRTEAGVELLIPFLALALGATGVPETANGGGR